MSQIQQKYLKDEDGNIFSPIASSDSILNGSKNLKTEIVDINNSINNKYHDLYSVILLNDYDNQARWFKILSYEHSSGASDSMFVILAEHLGSMGGTDCRMFFGSYRYSSAGGYNPGGLYWITPECRNIINKDRIAMTIKENGNKCQITLWYKFNSYYTHCRFRLIDSLYRVWNTPLENLQTYAHYDASEAVTSLPSNETIIYPN